MKFFITIILCIVVIVSFVAVSFTVNQVREEEERLRTDLQHRSSLLAESFKESVEPNFLNRSDEYLQSVVEKFANRERFAGLAIYDSEGGIIAVSSSLAKNIASADKLVIGVMGEDAADGDFLTLNGERIYAFVVPLQSDGARVVGALLVAQQAGYITNRIQEIWRNNLWRLTIQIFLISLAAIFLLRWIVYKPMNSLVASLQSARLDTALSTIQRLPNYPFLKPVLREIVKMRQVLKDARRSAQDEARLRLEKVDSPWTKERLKEFIKESAKGRTIFVVSNRESYIHTKSGNNTRYFFPASGMATAIEPLMRSCGGTWIAHGSGEADRLTVDKHDHIRVPPDDPKYTLRRVWLTDAEEQRYYYGFCNEGLWPLCHIAHTRPVFREEDWESYKQVNGKFAHTTLQEIKHAFRPLVLVQDFHCALLPRMIKKSRPDALVALFWHIPWPNPESVGICPFRKELLQGMLGADLIGFHTQLHCNNFIDTIGREMESLINWEQFAVTCGGHTTSIKPFPVGIAFANDYEYDAHDDSAQFQEKTSKKHSG